MHGQTEDLFMHPTINQINKQATMNFLNKTSQLKTVLVLSGILLFSTSFAADPFKLVDLKASALSSLSGTHEAGTSSVSISLGNLTDDPTYYNSCFSEAPGALRFNNYGASNYSYITIDNTGYDNITAVEITGACGFTGGASNLFVAFSDKPSSATSDLEYFYSLDYINPTLVFSDANTGCQAKPAILPNYYDTWGGAVYDQPEIEFIKSIKIALTTDFGDEEGMPQNPFILQGIIIYTDKNPTGINNTVAETFASYVAGGELKFSEPATKVSFYTISGTLVKTAENTQNVSLEDLPLGVYIVKALSNTGKTLVTKIAR